MILTNGNKGSSNRRVTYRTYNNFRGWHRDHRVTGRVVLDCVYPLGRDHLAFPELAREYEPHSVRVVHFIQWEQPRLVIDISETMELSSRRSVATRARSVTSRTSRLASGIAPRSWEREGICLCGGA